MRSDGTRDSDGMAGPVICCNLEAYNSVRIDRFRWHHSGKERQVAVVRPVMKTTTTADSNSSTSSSAAAATTTTAANLSSQSGFIPASARSSDNLSSNSRNISGHSRSILSVGNSSSSASSASFSSSSPAPPTSSISSSAVVSSQFPDSAPPIGWEYTWTFYYPNLTMSEAKQLLKPHPEGTFLLRNSSEPRYAYSLSVKTNRGTTSVRILRTSTDRYRLDCDPTQETVIPTFRSVPELIRHYLERNEEEQSGTGCGRGHRYVFLESTGRMDTPVLILRPLVKDSSLARRNITS